MQNRFINFIQILLPKLSTKIPIPRELQSLVPCWFNYQLDPILTHQSHPIRSFQIYLSTSKEKEKGRKKKKTRDERRIVTIAVKSVTRARFIRRAHEEDSMEMARIERGKFPPIFLPGERSWKRSLSRVNYSLATWGNILVLEESRDQRAA